MSYYYRYYDSVLKTEYELRTLQAIDYNKLSDFALLAFIELDIQINEEIPYSHTNTADIVDCDYYLSLSICGDPIYHIYKNGKLIKAFTRNITYIEDSLINLPASILCFFSNKLLLHCASILINGEAYALLGNKGLGKTTFSLLLSEHFPLLGDDTLMVTGLNEKGNIEVVPSQTFSKISPQTIENFKNRISWVSDFMLNSRKYLCRVQNSVIDDGLRRYCLKGLIVLNRSDSNYVSKNEIQVLPTKKILILKNIVGIPYFSYEYQNLLKDSKVFSLLCNLRVLTLSIPNGIQNLCQLKNRYIALLDSL